MAKQLDGFNEELYKLTSENNMPRITETEALSMEKKQQIEEVFQLNEPFPVAGVSPSTRRTA